MELYNQDLHALLLELANLEPKLCHTRDGDEKNILIAMSPGCYRVLNFEEPLDHMDKAAIEFSVLEAIASKTGWEVEIRSSPQWKVNIWRNNSESSTNTEALRDSRSHALLEAYISTLKAVKEVPPKAASMLRIVSEFLPELTFNANEDWTQWTWSYRCVESEEEKPDGFSSPLEALAHFAGKQSDLLDEILNWKPTPLDEVRRNLAKAQQVFQND